MDFSVLISVYKNDDPVHFDEAISSISSGQSLAPSEIVLVVDGPVSRGLNDVITKWEQQQEFPFVVVRSDENIGLANALNLGLSHCRFEYVARMDSDDVSLQSRFERQIEYLSKHPNVALLGSWYQQFDMSLQQLLNDRKVPAANDKILSYARMRTPFNHVTAIFRKSKVLEVGGYPDIRGFMEDWWLGLRLIKANYELANLPEYLVHVRGDKQFIGRRGGLTYLKHELVNLKQMHREQLMGTFDLMRNMLLRSTVRLIPNTARSLLYKAIRKF
ncbi:MAG: glycosyltransferase [Novipirellula sp. JB048]